MAQNKIYLGNEALVDLTGLATTSYVDTAVANVDVTDQLTNYVEKVEGKALSTNDFTDAYKNKLDGIDATSIDASIDRLDASVSNLEATLGDITGDGAAVTTALDTWAEIKQFVADYGSTDSLATLLNAHDASVVNYVDTSVAAGYIPNASYGDFAQASALANYVQTSELPTDHVQSTDVVHIVKISAEAFAALQTKDASTLYIVG